MLSEAYGDECLSRVHVFEWHKRFSEARNSVESNDRPCLPCISSIKENIAKVQETIQKDQRLSVNGISEMLHMDIESV